VYKKELSVLMFPVENVLGSRERRLRSENPNSTFFIGYQKIVIRRGGRQNVEIDMRYYTGGVEEVVFDGG